jgi:hypothetical protein
MRKKGFTTTILATVVMLGSLTGCGAEKVTAESLLSNAFGSEEVASLDANVVFDLDMDVDASSLMDSDSDTDTTMNFAVSLDCDVQSTKDVAHTDGKATVAVFGTKTKVDIESYTDIKNETAYTYNKDSDSWVKSDLDSSSFGFNNLSDKLSADLFDNLTLAERKSKDDDYVVTGTIAYKNIKDFVGEELENLSESTGADDLDLDKLSFDVTMNFDKDSKLVKSMTYSVDTKAFDSDDYTINKFEITTTVNSVNKNNDLSIPKDVEKNAVEKDSSFGGVENDLDTDFGVDTSNETTSESTSEATSESISDSDKTLAQMYLEKDYVYQDDLEGVLVNYYPNIKNLDSGAMTSLLTFFNNYTADEFANYLDVYDYWSDNEKIALAILYDIGIVDDETLSTFSISTVDIQSYVNNYVVQLQ